MRLVSTLVPLAVILAIPACSSEASGPAGTYSVTIDTTGMPAEAATAMAQMMTFGDLHLNADGTWDVSTEMDFMGQKQTNTVKGTWVLEGSEIVMTATEENGQAMVEPDVTRSAYVDGAFSIVQEEGGETFKMDMKKKDS